MIDLLFSSPLAFFIIFPGLLMSITLHEFAHCWITDKLGDPTPRAKGRITLDPRAHLDPLGTVMILFTRFGWGKPAPFDPYNLKEPVRDTALIAAAGPLSNLVIATLLAIILNLNLITAPIIQIAFFNILIINIVLAVFNLIPVYPLDGSKIILALLPASSAFEFESFMNRYGIFILLLLIFPWGGGVSPINALLSPLINLITNLLIV
jgi:Zn-dependent protease